MRLKDKDLVISNFNKHDENSPLLLGNINEDDIIKEAKQESYKDIQLSLF